MASFPKKKKSPFPAKDIEKVLIILFFCAIAAIAFVEAFEYKIILLFIATWAIKNILRDLIEANTDETLEDAIKYLKKKKNRDDSA